MLNVPEVQAVEFMTKTMKNIALTYQQLKQFIIQAEANKQQTGTTSSRAALMARRDPRDRCME